MDGPGGTETNQAVRFFAVVGWVRVFITPERFAQQCPATIKNGSRRQLKLTPGDNYK